jgi:hypothetical protein
VQGVVFLFARRRKGTDLPDANKAQQQMAKHSQATTKARTETNHAYPVRWHVMPRKLRVEYSEAIYHVMNRGDRRESIFLGDSDRPLFLETLAQTCEEAERPVP